jgi:hypothetical protein
MTFSYSSQHGQPILPPTADNAQERTDLLDDIVHDRIGLLQVGREDL